MFKEGRISREKVLTRGQLQVKPFYNQPAEQARLRAGPQQVGERRGRGGRAAEEQGQRGDGGIRTLGLGCGRAVGRWDTPGLSKQEGPGERDRPELPPKTALEGPARRGARGSTERGADLELYGRGFVVHDHFFFLTKMTISYFSGCLPAAAQMGARGECSMGSLLEKLCLIKAISFP